MSLCTCSVYACGRITAAQSGFGVATRTCNSLGHTRQRRALSQNPCRDNSRNASTSFVSTAMVTRCRCVLASTRADTPTFGGLSLFLFLNTELAMQCLEMAKMAAAATKIKKKGEKSFFSVPSPSPSAAAWTSDHRNHQTGRARAPKLSTPEMAQQLVVRFSLLPF